MGRSYSKITLPKLTFHNPEAIKMKFYVDESTVAQN